MPTVGIQGTRHAFNTDDRDRDPNQQGTQMDALGHFAVLPEAWDGKGEFPSGGAAYYGGYKQSEVKPTPDSPLKKLGIDKVPPIVTTAVLLDAKAHLGRGSAMQPGQLVTAADIEAMLMRRASSAVASWLATCSDLTGWGDNWKDPDTECHYTKAGPPLRRRQIYRAEGRFWSRSTIRSPIRCRRASCKGRGHRPRARRRDCHSRSITTT